MNIVCLYHRDCLDGLTSAWIMKQAFGEDQKVTFIATDYNKPLPTLPSPCVVYILDFSYDFETLKRLAKNEFGVVMLDHHPRSIDIVGQFNQWLTAEMPNSSKLFHAEHKAHQSGALMTWSYFFPDKAVPQFVLSVSDRDLWQFKLYETREITAGLMTYPLTLEGMDEAIGKRSIYRVHEDFALLGETALRIQALNVAWAIEHTLRMHPFSWQQNGATITTCVPMINCPHGVTSDALHQLSEGYPFAVSYYDTDESRKFSLRSKTTDVRPIAQHYGGNGHEHAAGFFVSRDHPLAKI